MSKNTQVNRSKGAGRWLLAAAAVAGLSVAAVGQNARATTTTLGSFTLSGFNGGDGTTTNALNATVIFSYVSGSSNGNLDVTIENNSMPQSDGELIRNIDFQVSGITPGSSAAYLPNGATELTDSGNGAYSVATIAVGPSTNLQDDWALTTGSGTSGGYFNLTSEHTQTGKPTDFVGPSIVAGSSPYSNYADGKNSVQNSSPIVAGPVTFQVEVSGLTANSSISNVLVGYGTSGGITGPLTPSTTPTPEPSVLAFLGMGAIGSLMFMRKRR